MAESTQVSTEEAPRFVYKKLLTKELCSKGFTSFKARLSRLEGKEKVITLEIFKYTGETRTNYGIILRGNEIIWLRNYFQSNGGTQHHRIRIERLERSLKFLYWDKNFEKTFYMPCDAVESLFKLLAIFIFIMKNQMDGVRENAIARFVTIAVLHNELDERIPMKENQTVAQDGYRTIHISVSDVTPIIDKMIKDGTLIPKLTKFFEIFGARSSVGEKWITPEQIHKITNDFVIYTLYHEDSVERVFINNIKMLSLVN